MGRFMEMIVMSFAVITPLTLDNHAQLTLFCRIIGKNIAPAARRVFYIAFILSLGFLALLPGKYHPGINSKITVLIWVCEIVMHCES